MNLKSWLLLIVPIFFAVESTETLARKKGFKIPAPQHRMGEIFYKPALLEAVPDSYDLRALGFIGPVRDQGNCGSCWAFGSVASLESMVAKKFGKLLDLSEQEIVSCATQGGVMGCNGGSSVGAWEYSSVNPLVSEQNYPYVSGLSGTTGKCKSMKNNERLVSATGSYKRIVKEDDIRSALVGEGAVAIGISADNACFMNYKSGILDPTNCPCGGEVDHLIAVVGYGNENGTDYWIVRNSWGTGWGEKGYVRFKRNVNQCQMMSFATIPNDVSKTKYAR